jgi:hypothetical protein
MLTSLARYLREMVGLPTLYGSHQPVAFRTRSLAGASLDGGLPPWMAHGSCEFTEHDVEADIPSGRRGGEVEHLTTAQPAAVYPPSVACSPRVAITVAREKQAN